jgi:sec-independent protein translocase protein TatA
MFDIGGGELILIILGIIILFGPEKLPEIVKLLSKGLYKIREAQTQFKTQLSSIQEELNNATEVKNTNVESINLDVSTHYENIDLELLFDSKKGDDNYIDNKLNINNTSIQKISIIDENMLSENIELK